MSAPSQAQTYDLTVGVMLDIEDMIQLISPHDTPFLGGAGSDGRSILPTGNCFEKKVEWLDEELLLPNSTLGAAVSTTTATNITVASGDQQNFTTGDVLLIEDEYVRVTSYSATTADVLVVTRGYGSSTAATHSSALAVLSVGTALVEGSDPENPRFQDRNNRFNYTQIFGPHAITVSGTENVVRKYGLRGQTEFNKQVANRLMEVAVGIEQMLAYGVRVEDTTNMWRTAGGLAYYVTAANGSVMDTSTTVITEAKLLDMLQSVYNNGGNPDRIIGNATQKRKISAFSSALTINVNRTDTGRGITVDTFTSDFGECTIALHRWLRTQDVFVINRDQAQVATLRPIVMEMLAKTGDSMKGQIVGEKTFKFRRSSHAGRFTALT